MKAAQSYSSSLRAPAVAKLVPPFSSSQLPPISAASPGKTLEVSDGNDIEIEQFSDDEDCNDDYLPSLSVEESNMLFYRPSGKWADLGECPIEDPIVLAKLHCE